MAPREEHNYFVGDSLTLIWHSPSKQDSYLVQLMSLFEENLVDTTIHGNSLVLPIREFKKLNSNFVIKISSQQIASVSLLAKSPNKKDRLEFDFDARCILADDFIQQKVLLAGLCEIHGLFYDQIHHLYSLYRYSIKTGVVINHPYYHRMLKEYNFEWFLAIN